MANYVKFRRGNPAAFKALLETNQAEIDTLYFIYNEDEAVGELYLGSKLIAGGSTIEGATLLRDLQDVLLSSQLNKDDCLIYDTSVDGGKWVNKPIIDILPIFVGANGDGSVGVPGLVPATDTDNPNLFLRSDGTWAEVVIAPTIETDNVTLENVDGVLSIVGFKDAPEGAQLIKDEDGSLNWVKPDLTTVETLKEDVEDIKQILSPTDTEGNPVEGGLIAEVEKKADATEVQKALDAKAEAADVEAALDLKANVEDVNAALDLKADAAEVEEALEQKANATDVYTKTETDNVVAAAVNEAIANVDHLTREIVSDLPAIEDADPNIIYMIPSGLLEDDNKYYEWIVINGVFERVGSWEVDLSAYVKSSDLAIALDGKVDKIDNARLMTDAEGIKLANIAENAERNVVNSVSADFEILSDEAHDRQLVLKPIAMSKVVGLENALNGKVDKEEGWTLLSPSDQAKLAKLSIDEESGDIGISGTVNVENVQGLEDWLNKNAGKLKGLSENNLTDELYNKLVDQLFIKTVETTQLDVTENHLSIKAVEMDKVTGLNDILALKASAEQVNNLSTAVGSLQESLNDQIAKINDIESRLMWHGLTE